MPPHGNSVDVGVGTDIKVLENIALPLLIYLPRLIHLFLVFYFCSILEIQLPFSLQIDLSFYK